MKILPEKMGIYVSFPGKILLRTYGRMRMIISLNARSAMRGMPNFSLLPCKSRNLWILSFRGVSTTRNLNNSSLLRFLPSVEMTNNGSCAKLSSQEQTLLFFRLQLPHAMLGSRQTVTSHINRQWKCFWLSASSMSWNRQAVDKVYQLTDLRFIFEDMSEEKNLINQKKYMFAISAKDQK